MRDYLDGLVGMWMVGTVPPVVASEPIVKRYLWTVLMESSQLTATLTPVVELVYRLAARVCMLTLM